MFVLLFFCCSAWFVPGNRCCVHVCVACCSQPVVCILCWHIAGQQCEAHCPLYQFAAVFVSGMFMLGINRYPWIIPAAMFLALPRWAATQEVLQHRQLVRGDFRLLTVILVGSDRGGRRV